MCGHGLFAALASGATRASGEAWDGRMLGGFRCPRGQRHVCPDGRPKGSVLWWRWWFLDRADRRSRERRHEESGRRVTALWLRAQRRAASWKVFGFTPKRERKAEAKLLGLL